MIGGDTPEITEAVSRRHEQRNRANRVAYRVGSAVGHTFGLLVWVAVFAATVALAHQVWKFVQLVWRLT